MREDKQIQIEGTHGKLLINTETGDVLNSTGKEYLMITKFDIKEYKKFWNVKELPESIDILNIGYWFDCNQYEKPCNDWREELKKSKDNLIVRFK